MALSAALSAGGTAYTDASTVRACVTSAGAFSTACTRAGTSSQRNTELLLLLLLLLPLCSPHLCCEGGLLEWLAAGVPARDEEEAPPCEAAAAAVTAPAAPVGT